jgi:hypothetical protein
MKNYISFVLVAFLTSNVLIAQESLYNNLLQNYPDRRLQIGSTVSDLAILNATIDINYRYNKNQAIGLEFNNFSTATLYDSPLNADLIGQGLKVYQKIYIRDINHYSYSYFRHGFRGDRSSIRYDEEGWFPFEENGSTLLVYEERSFTENSFRMGYDVMFGIETNHDRFFLMDFFIGVAYLQQFNADRFVSSNTVSPLFSGFKPVGGFRLAVYLDRDYGNLFIPFSKD